MTEGRLYRKEKKDACAGAYTMILHKKQVIHVDRFHSLYFLFHVIIL
jgi:hypothetical protein